MAQLQRRWVADPQLLGQDRRWLALAHPAEQQHNLWGCQMALLEDRPCIHIVRTFTVMTAVDEQLTVRRLPKRPSFIDWRTALRTAKTARMKMVEQPRHATFVIE